MALSTMSVCVSSQRCDQSPGIALRSWRSVLLAGRKISNSNGHREMSGDSHNIVIGQQHLTDSILHTFKRIIIDGQRNRDMHC